MSLVLLSCHAAVVCAQYPADETIRPYPKRIKERVLIERFECNARELSRWQSPHQAELSIVDGHLKMTSTGTDPYVTLPPIGQPTDGPFELRIRMKNNMASRSQIFWKTTKRNIFQQSSSTLLRFVRGDDWHVYSIPLDEADTLTGIRFDPGASQGVAEIDGIELYKIVHDEGTGNPRSWVDPNWADGVNDWMTISSGNLDVRFDQNGTGAQIFLKEKHVGDIYPLAHLNPDLPVGGIPRYPFYHEDDSSEIARTCAPLDAQPVAVTKNMIRFRLSLKGVVFGVLEFQANGHEIGFELKNTDNVSTASFGPVFRPKGKMREAVLCGVEYLEAGEHSSSTADIETEAHLRYAPKPLDVTWPFMSIVTDRAAFGFLWNSPTTQTVFATPDFILGDSQSHYMGLHGTSYGGTVNVVESAQRKRREDLTDLENLFLWAIKKFGLPELPERPRDDEGQRRLNLAAFEESILHSPSEGWRHAIDPRKGEQHFPATYGCDFVTAIWQLTGSLPSVPRLGSGGAHLRNPASFLLSCRAEQMKKIYADNSKAIRDEQRANGDFVYDGKFLRGHWENVASGHSGHFLYRLMFNYRVLGDKETFLAAQKGLDAANRFLVPRGGSVWELSLHTPDLLASSRMCLANVWMYEETNDAKYLDAARRWAITGLPFVYFWQDASLKTVPVGVESPIMLYATTPAFGATKYTAPNWIGLPVQWVGLDYGEALFALAEHDKTLEWKKIAEGILITGERMQYPNGKCVGLLPDSLELDIQLRNPYDINPTVLVMQRRRLQGKPGNIVVAVSPDGKHRIVAPYKTEIESESNGKVHAVIEAVEGTTYQVLLQGNKVVTIPSQGVDRLPLN